jgi:hypothetical protein
MFPDSLVPVEELGRREEFIIPDATVPLEDVGRVEEEVFTRGGAMGGADCRLHPNRQSSNPKRSRRRMTIRIFRSFRFIKEKIRFDGSNVKAKVEV